MITLIPRYREWRLRKLRAELHIAEQAMSLGLAFYCAHPCRSTSTIRAAIWTIEQKLGTPTK